MSIPVLILDRHYNIVLKLASFKSLSELPTSRHDIVVCDSPAIAGSHFEREALAVKVSIALPVLAPISGHR